MKKGTPRCHQKGEKGPCKAPPLAGQEFCFFHHPEKAEERGQANKKGGRERQKKRRDVPHAVLDPNSPDEKLESAEDVLVLVRRTVGQVTRGQIDPKVANSVSQALGVALKALEAKDTDGRLKKLEDEFRPLKGLAPDKLLEIARASGNAPDPSPH